MACGVVGRQSNPHWNLDRVNQRNLPLDNGYNYDFDGTGLHAYVLDTGIRITHQEFANRASHDFNALPDGRIPDDCHGHGTFVAGLIGGSTVGVAKNVRLHAVRIVRCDGSGTAAQAIDGVEWVTKNAIAPAVVNMSVGVVRVRALQPHLHTKRGVLPQRQRMLLGQLPARTRVHRTSFAARQAVVAMRATHDCVHALAEASATPGMK